MLAQQADVTFLKAIHAHRNTSLDKPMQFISDSEYLIGTSIPLLFVLSDLTSHSHQIKNYQPAIAILSNTAATYVLKKVINRPRPAASISFVTPYEDDMNYSFPSGHSSNAFCLATSMSLYSKQWKIAIPAYIWAGAVGYSRMHLGAHYPSDVLGGAILGVASAWISYRVSHWMWGKSSMKQNNLTFSTL
ncbi:MAG: phosphatase PAP2 family protein [Chitinophagaceae bacterium]